MSKKLNKLSEQELEALIANLKEQLEGVRRKKRNLEFQEENLEHRIKQIQEKL